MEKPNFGKTNDQDNERVEELVQGMIDRDFTPKHPPTTQEERQAAWDELKEKQSRKFDPNNITQEELF